MVSLDRRGPSAGAGGQVRDPGPFAYGVYLTELREVFRLAAPDLLTRPVLAALGAIGRARGYRVIER